MLSRIAIALVVCAYVTLAATAADEQYRFDAALRGAGTLGARGEVGYTAALWCEPDQRENRLEVVWGGQTFALTRVVDALCFDGPAPGLPRDANFDTHRGEGVGRYGGREGARVSWTFVDGGQARGALAELAIHDLAGNELLRVSGVVRGSNVASGTAILPLAPREDPENVVHSLDIDENGRPVELSVTRLPRSAFVEQRGGASKPDEVPEPVLPKLDADLEAAIARGNADERVSVVVNLADPADVPRLPDLPLGVRRDSPEGAAVVAERAAIIERLEALRQRSVDAFLRRAGRSGASDVRVLERFWLVNAFVADVRLGDVATLAARPDVVYVQANQPSVPVLPPNHHGIPHGDLQLARARIGSDAYFNLTGMLDDSIGQIDTGTAEIHPTTGILHPLIYKAAQIVGDCVHGDAHCLAPFQNPQFSTWDCFDHGTSVAGILNGNGFYGPATRGVTSFLVDQWKVWSRGHLPPLHCNFLNFDGPLNDAILRAFQAGLYSLDHTFAVELQMQEPHTGIVATAANKAFDAGAAVVAANGNCAVDATCTKWFGAATEKTVRSPAVAHKVLGVGVYNVVDLNTWDYQSRGPTPDGRIKPDLQAPTDVQTASRSDTEGGFCEPVFGFIPCRDPEDPPYRKLSFGGTSAATGFGAGGAALMRRWLKKYQTFDPGATYARMILSGDRTWGASGYSNLHGAGHMRLPDPCGIRASWSKVSFPLTKKGVTPAVEIAVPVTLGDSLAAAIWWPETPGTHNDVDLQILDPLGNLLASAVSSPSVFERAEVAGPLMPGTWKVRIVGAKLQSPQQVYWTADVRGAYPCKAPAP